MFFRKVRVNLNAGTILEPGDFADGPDTVAAYDNGVFGLQRTEFLEIDKRRVVDFLVCGPHAKRNAAKNACKCQKRKVA